MEDYKKEQYEKIFDKYKKATMISYGSPDQFQFRQNELMLSLAEFILTPYWQWEHEKATQEQLKLEDQNDRH